MTSLGFYSAFVPHKMIYNNVIMAHELIYTLKRKKHGKFESVALKIDMSKAYDRVELSFLEAFMKKVGFPLVFINLVISFINFISFSIM